LLTGKRIKNEYKIWNRCRSSNRKHIENNDTRIKHNNSLVQEDFEKIYDWLYEIDNDIEMLIEFARFTENKWADSYATDDTYERKWGTKPPSED
jgi:hypothetical protein